MTEPRKEQLVCPICDERADTVTVTAGNGTWASHEVETGHSLDWETHQWPIPEDEPMAGAKLDRLIIDEKGDWRE